MFYVLRATLGSVKPVAVERVKERSSSLAAWCGGWFEVTWRDCHEGSVFIAILLRPTERHPPPTTRVAAEYYSD